MIALYIVGGLILFSFVLTMLPITVFLKFNGDFITVIRFCGIKIFDSSKSKPKRPKKKSKPETGAEPQENKKKKNKISDIFEKQKEKNGTIGAVKFFGEIIGIVLKRAIWVIKKLKFDRINLNLVIASEDAAQTAILYGTVCSFAYPILSLITANAKVYYKEINISADFNKTATDLRLSLIVRARMIYALIAAVKGYFEFRKALKGEDKKCQRIKSAE